MSRTQFSFTFTNAQPGASVHFSAPVYADATTSKPDGPTLVLSSANAVSVWADAGFLIAMTVDGNGNDLAATATATAPSVTNDTGTAGTSPFAGGGSSQAGTSIVRAFPFAFDTPDLVTGHTVYTPAVGDFLIDAWIDVEVAWDGTTPFADIGTFIATEGSPSVGVGMFDFLGGPLDMTMAWNDPEQFCVGIASYNHNSVLSERQASWAVGNELAVPAIASTPHAVSSLISSATPQSDQSGRFVPARIRAANPIKVVVSQDGTAGGTDPGSTQGAATLYLVTATPATA